MKKILERTMKCFINRRPVVVLRADEPVSSAISILPELDTGAACVIDSRENLVGIVTVRDVLKRVMSAGLDPQKAKISEIMTASPRTVSVDDCIHETLDIMTSSGYRYLPIMDSGTVVGMADIRDLYEAIQSLLHQKVEYKASLMARMFSEPYGYDPHTLSDSLVQSGRAG